MNLLFLLALIAQIPVPADATTCVIGQNFIVISTLYPTMATCGPGNTVSMR